MRYISNLGSKRIIALFLFIFLFHYSFSFAKSYSNPSATVYYTLNPDGTVSVHEKIVYDIQCSSSDCYHELYTWHPPSLKITSPSGHCIETDCRFFTQYNQGNYELVLRNDNGFTTGTYTAVFDYTLEGEILEQKDTAQFFYKIWYDQWPNEIGTLYATVIIPRSVTDTVYFIHPSSSLITASNSSNSVLITSSNHPANQYLEINLLMPKEWFTNLRKAPDYMTKEEIIKGETGGINLSWLGSLAIIFGIFILLFPPAFFVYVYFKYGKEEEFPELSSLPPYIRDISEIGDDISPTEAALLLAPPSATQKNLPSDIISAEMMELVRLGYLEIEETESRDVLTGNKKIFFIPIKKDASKLSDVQLAILNFINTNLKNGKFSFETQQLDLSDLGGSISYSTIFEASLIALISQLRIKFLDMLKEKKYIDLTGHYLMNTVFGVWSAISFLYLFLMMYLAGLVGEMFAIAMFIGIFMSFFAYTVIFAFINLRPDILGKWTREGRIKHEKILRYKKFMEELTLMKDKLPQDITLWEKMLVYATALGVSYKVVDAMKVVLPDYNTNVRLRSFSTAAVTLPRTSAATMLSYAGAGRSRGGSGGGHGGGGGGGGAR